MIDILKLRNNVIEDYRKYVESFIDIRDERLKQKAQEILNDGNLWPDPLLQCNPGFEKGETVEVLIDSGVLHKDMAHIFTGFQLHKHQSEAIKIGTSDKGFIVTSGTGSGKSLTYLGTVFNRVLSHPEQGGVTAIIVYPMNALINSQELEIKKYQRNFLQRHLPADVEWGAGSKSLDDQIEELNVLATRQFPITFGKYTGQESEAKKQDMIDKPKHIMLTNYMMLEYLLTRSKEASLREAIFSGLQFLVFDELHTYRGRQGADVAMLIRRMKALAKKNLICLSTSATLSSGSLHKQQKDIAHLGKQLFDEDYAAGQIIGESLEARISRPMPNAEELKDALLDRLPVNQGVTTLEAHPLTCWLEQKVALERQEGRLVRGTPQTIAQIVDQLANDGGLDREKCALRISELLQWLQQVNQHQSDGILPFRVHQFVAQTGTIRVTLESATKREIIASEELYISRDGKQLPLFPVVFNRHSGLPYVRVIRVDGRFQPWEGNIDQRSKEEDSGEEGYVLLDETRDDPLWDEARAQELIPDTWMEKRKSGLRIRRDRQKRLPQRIWFKPDGTYSEVEIPNAEEGWFMKAPLMLDPLSGVIYDARTRDFNKLAQLGDAGRSTSTTILSYSTLQQLEAQQASERVRKIMSFTDNRQDAALQSGHFNDFIQQALLRSAIYRAVKNHGCRTTDNIASSVFEELKISETDYAQIPGTRHHQIRENEKVFKKWLLHQLLFDLRRSWQHRLPNLEQCGLLEIRYKWLCEEAARADAWQGSEFLKSLNEHSRCEFLRQFLNYFRSTFAVKHFTLEEHALEETRNQMRSKLQDRFARQFDEARYEPRWMRLEPEQSKRIQTVSIGASSSLGQYVRFFAKQQNIPMDHKGVAVELPNILESLRAAGYLVKDEKLTNQPLYRLDLDQLEWIPGDPDDMVSDAVRYRSAKAWKQTPNEYFQALYMQAPEQLKQLESREHTGQVPAEERQQIERDFRKAEVKALFCSSTMELGIDIDELAVVHMRNVPPNPANYAQRSGRAGRKGQGALVITFCSSQSAHDKHFFREKMDMVTGKVTPQQLDLANPDLLRTHLNAAYLSKCQISALNRSFGEVLDLDNEDLPLLPSIREQLDLSIAQKHQLHEEFTDVIQGLLPLLEKQPWFSEEWVSKQIEDVPRAFDKAMDRWRDLYVEADKAKAEALMRQRETKQIGRYSEFDKGGYLAKSSHNKVALLLNNGDNNQFSEFYPYRYLASEGFLPGYNFTRLPVRVFLSDFKGSGTYISRPRLQALVEFGPGNTLYQNGKKWRVGQMSLPPSEAGLTLEKLHVDKDTGHFSLGKDISHHDVNAFSGKPFSEHDEEEVLPNMTPLNDMTAYHSDRISSQEDERSREVFTTELGFSLGKSASRESKIRIEHEGDALIRLRYLPVADLVRLNLKLARSKDSDGFWLHSDKGTWESEKSVKEASEEDSSLIRKVRLYTKVTADCLCMDAAPTLHLDASGVTSMAYAFKRALEVQYQAEPEELAVQFMGDPKRPKVLFYESAEGSLGILSRLADDPGEIERLIECMWQVCRFDDNAEDESPATYDDLLSYYNQRYHRDIDRLSIKQALSLMQRAEVRITSSS